MPQFEVFRRGTRSPESKAPFVTIRRAGNFAISLGAFELLGSPVAVHLLNAPDEGGIVGMRPCDPEDPDAYLVRGGSAKKPTDRTIAATAYVDHYGIASYGGQRFPAYLDDGVLCIKLSAGSVVSPVRRPAAPALKQVLRSEEEIARTRTIRQWGIANGLLSRNKPGRLPQSVIDEYDLQHPRRG